MGGVVNSYIPFGATPVMFVSCSFGSQPVSIITWASTAAVESVLFIMVFMKSRSRKKDEQELRTASTQCNLLTILARDSTVYYGM